MNAPGESTSEPDVEVTQISKHGLWLWLRGREHFLPYAEFPWFKVATVEQILDVELSHGTQLHWPRLDVDLHVDSLTHPEQYPLVAR